VKTLDAVAGSKREKYGNVGGEMSGNGKEGRKEVARSKEGERRG